VNDSYNTSDIDDEDDVLEIPLGLGVSYHRMGFLGDVRGTVRPAFDSELMGAGNELHTWAAEARLGFEL